MYTERSGAIVELYPDRWCTCNISKIEAIPFYHAWPGSRSLVIGTAGCNFVCRYCVNSFIAREEPATLQNDMFDFSAEELVAIAEKWGCHNIVFNVNEPTVSLPSLVRLSQAASEKGLPMGCLTNGYMTVESCEIMASVFQFINVSLKGLSSEFLNRYIGIDDIGPVLRNIKRLMQTNHVEITMPVIQTVNDGELTEMAAWLADIDEDIPFHVLRLLPEYKMKDTAYPDIGHINAILESVREKLNNVYFHNFVGSDWVNTICPECKTEVIERLSLGCGGDRLVTYSCVENRCPVCGREIKMTGRKVEWNSMKVAR